MNITVRNIPDEVIEKIRTLSKMEKRSLNSEILIVLEKGIQEELHQRFDIKKNISKSAQIDIWEKLSNQWQDERSTDDIIKDIYENRTLGREVKL
jgi:plasmid stability protein